MAHINTFISLTTYFLFCGYVLMLQELATIIYPQYKLFYQ